MQKVKQLTELAGVDVIVVHRMLKNAVPVPEYLLMTKPVHAMIGSPLHERAAPLDARSRRYRAHRAFYLDLTEWTDALPPPRKLPPWRRLARHVSLGLRTLPRELGLRKSCVGFRNVPDAPDHCAAPRFRGPGAATQVGRTRRNGAVRAFSRSSGQDRPRCAATKAAADGSAAVGQRPAHICLWRRENLIDRVQNREPTSRDGCCCARRGRKGSVMPG